jgi:hypothetical protein
VPMVTVYAWFNMHSSKMRSVFFVAKRKS